MRAKLIINPYAGRGAGRRLGPRIRRFLSDGSLGCSASFSRQPGDITQQARSACRDGVDWILVAGGDGSVYEAVNGIVSAGADASLGIIPIGTGNDFARAAGLPGAWQAACRRILEGTPRRIDIGRCNGHHFANGVGIGFDAEAAIAANGIRLLPRRWIYAAGLLLTTLRGVRTPHVTIEDDRGVQHQRVTLIAVCNGEYYGGGFHITPRARIDDGLLDVVIADPITRLGVMRFAPRVVAGTHLGLPVVTYRHVRRIIVRCEDGVPVQADGEILYTRTRTVEIEALPKRLGLLG